ncbi:hypothetical protein GCM10020255_029940 [Rhodococcus baikonurensis]
MKRTVAALLDIEIDEATNLEFKIAVTRAPGTSYWKRCRSFMTAIRSNPVRLSPNTAPGFIYSTVPQAH